MSDAPSPEQQPEGPTQEEFARALAERLAHTPVRDVLFQSLITFLDMAAVRLGMGPAGPAVADPTQGRQAIEAGRAPIVSRGEMGPSVRPILEPPQIRWPTRIWWRVPVRGVPRGCAAGAAAPAAAPPRQGIPTGSSCGCRRGPAAERARSGPSPSEPVIIP